MPILKLKYDFVMNLISKNEKYSYLCTVDSRQSLIYQAVGSVFYIIS